MIFNQNNTIFGFVIGVVVVVVMAILFKVLGNVDSL